MPTVRMKALTILNDMQYEGFVILGQNFLARDDARANYLISEGKARRMTAEEIEEADASQP